MQLADYQHLLAKIYTNADFRKAFFAQPKEIGAKFGLSEELSLNLAHTYQKEIQLFSQTLIRKRLGALRVFVPLCAQILAGQLEILFMEYADNQSLSFEDRYAEDAFEFISFLQKHPHFKSLSQLEQTEILFEKLQIRSEKFYFRIYLFPYHPLNKKKQRNLYVHFHLGKWYWWKILTLP